MAIPTIQTRTLQLIESALPAGGRPNIWSFENLYDELDSPASPYYLDTLSKEVMIRTYCHDDRNFLSAIVNKIQSCAAAQAMTKEGLPPQIRIMGIKIMRRIAEIAEEALMNFTEDYQKSDDYKQCQVNASKALSPESESVFRQITKNQFKMLFPNQPFWPYLSDSQLEQLDSALKSQSKNVLEAKKSTIVRLHGKLYSIEQGNGKMELEHISSFRWLFCICGRSPWEMKENEVIAWSSEEMRAIACHEVYQANASASNRNIYSSSVGYNQRAQQPYNNFSMPNQRLSHGLQNRSVALLQTHRATPPIRYASPSHTVTAPPRHPGAYDAYNRISHPVKHSNPNFHRHYGR